MKISSENRELFSFYPRQMFAKLGAGAVDVRLNRAQWQLHDFGDLVVRIILDVPKQDTGPVFGAELADGALDLLAELFGFELLERRFPCAGEGDGRRAF